MKTYQKTAIKLKAILLLILFTFSSFAQDKKEVKFILNLMAKEKNQNICYTGSIEDYDIKQIIISIKSNRSFIRSNKSLVTNINQIKFTEIEQKNIINQIEAANNTSWGANKLKNYKYISKDSLVSISKRNPYFYYLNFTKPIFIRKNRLCIFYSGYTEGGFLNIYIKQKRKWHYFATIYEWLG